MVFKNRKGINISKKERQSIIAIYRKEMNTQLYERIAWNNNNNNIRKKGKTH
jgi:hypothetical protein